MKFIQDKLNEEHPIEYDEHSDNLQTGETTPKRLVKEGVSGIVADANACTLQWNHDLLGIPEHHIRLKVSLKNVEQLSVIAYQQVFSSPNSRIVQSPTPFAIVLSVNSQENSPNGQRFIAPIGVEETANRIAKAISHAVELCGGGGAF
jgi:hypothetical protein